jgi:hypothetical protein
MPKSVLVNFMMDPRDLERLEDYRFAHRFPSRAAAIYRLIMDGIARAEEPSTATTGPVTFS